MGKVGKIFRVEVGGDRQVGIKGNTWYVLGNTVGGSETVEMKATQREYQNLQGQ